jgi:hypothetical protein
MDNDLMPESETDLKILDFGTQSFENSRNLGHVYVDKTDLIAGLLQPKSGIVFLTRPRRFGKSFLLNTIRNIFEGKRKLFEGLAIDNLKPDYDWDISRDIFIDMSDLVYTPSQINDSLTNKI